jgi:hypothetical protein
MCDTCNELQCQKGPHGDLLILFLDICKQTASHGGFPQHSYHVLLKNVLHPDQDVML